MSDNPVLTRKQAADLDKAFGIINDLIGDKGLDIYRPALRARASGNWRCAVPCNACGGSGVLSRMYHTDGPCPDCRNGWIVLED